MSVFSCEVHTYHRPQPMRTIVHHVQPLAMGGTDLAENKVHVCDTGHYNIHRLLADLIQHGKMRQGGTREERRLARVGYSQWVAAGQPGRPVFQAHFGVAE